MTKRFPILSLCLLGCALLAAGGCTSRQAKVELEELRADNERLSSEIYALSKENLILAEQRDKARAENQRLRAHLDGYEKQLADLSKSGPLPMGMTPLEGGNGVAMGSDFAFKKGSADLNTDAQNSIRELAARLNSGEFADTYVIIQGHTDNTPVVRPATKQKFGNNWGLSAMRAAAVVTALQDAGVKPNRIRGSFLGEYSPQASNKTNDGKAANRRVEIYLQLPTGG